MAILLAFRHWSSPRLRHWSHDEAGALHSSNHALQSSQDGKNGGAVKKWRNRPGIGLAIADSDSSRATPCLSRRSCELWNAKEAKRVGFLAFRSPRCAMNLYIGEESFHYRSIPKFPRMHIRDPYKLLGVTYDASEEEIRGARNFLVEQYCEHEPSVESIELAYEKIMMKSFKERQKEKINWRTMLQHKVNESPPWFQNLLGFFEVPIMHIVWRRAFLFGFMAGWSIFQSAETGPAFQVALSLMCCIFFLNEKMKNGFRAFMTGLGALVMGWTVGSVLIPFIPAFLFPPTWSLELLTALVSYVFLFLACVFLK